MKKIFTQLLFCTMIAFGLVWQIAGQDREIDREKYFAAFSAADSKSEATYPRRQIVVTERFEKCKSVFLETDTYEYASPDASRRIVEMVNKGKRSVGKYINIGNTYYCEEDAKPFKKSDSPCEPVSMEMSPDPDTQNFSVGKITEGERVFTIYRMHTLRSYSPNSKDKPKTFSFAQVFTLRPNGKFANIDIESAIETEPKDIYKKITTRFEYGVTIPKIEAPIKQTLFQDIGRTEANIK